MMKLRKVLTALVVAFGMMLASSAGQAWWGWGPGSGWGNGYGSGGFSFGFSASGNMGGWGNGLYHPYYGYGGYPYYGGYPVYGAYTAPVVTAEAEDK